LLLPGSSYNLAILFAEKVILQGSARFEQQVFSPLSLLLRNLKEGVAVGNATPVDFHALGLEKLLAPLPGSGVGLSPFMQTLQLNKS
jgi:hypothetical protein